MHFQLDGQIAVVTGASGGIGRAIALALAESGAEVLLHTNRQPEVALSTVQSIQKGGGKASFLTADLSVPEKQDAFVQSVLSMHSNIDHWINAAGVDLMSDANRDLSYEEKLKLLWSVDFLAAVRMSKQIGKRMKQVGKGTILFFGWDGVDRGMAGDTAELYGAVKGAIHGFTKSFAHSLAPEVRVNCISPGWIETTWGKRASVSMRERGSNRSLMNRWGNPEDVASAALFLVSNAASYVNGQCLALNGGFRFY
ncbi:MAG: SDR family oxidoreductase [Planctomycetaceae bacterium]|nr:SDR family oxidoreductase [Planctomycetaceae bacterium]